MRIRPVGTELFHRGKHDEANSRFLQILRTHLKTRKVYEV